MNEQIEAFNLTRMFLGTQTDWLFLAEVIFRTLIMFTWVLLNIRFLGKRNIAQLTPFEYVLVIAIGSSAGDPMFYPEVPILHGMIVISGVIGLEKLLSYLTLKDDQFEKFAEGEPRLLIENGKILDFALKKENINKQEIFSRLREQNIENTGKVKLAFIETSGMLGIIKYEKGKEVQGEDTTQIG